MTEFNGGNKENTIRLLRGIANALEQDRASFVDYEMYDSIRTYGARETEVEIRIEGLDAGVLLENLEGAE